MHNLQIQPITTEQLLPACAALLTAAYNAEPWKDEWTDDIALRKLQCFYRSPDFIGYIAYLDGQLVGACLGNIEPYYTGDYFYLKEMFVTPGIQKQGVGRQLLETLKQQLATREIQQMILFTSRAFFPFHFYKNAGFNVMEDMVMMHFQQGE